MINNLKGKVALITGSSSGIGEAVALLFAKEGADVIINSNKSVEKGKKVLEKALKLNSNACYIQADLTKEEDVDRLFKEIENKYGHIDILVNNTGATSSPASIKEISVEDLDTEMKVNLTSAVLCTKKVIPLMKKGGNIINTSSIRGLEHVGRSGILGYSMAKAAMNSFTRTVARDLAPSIMVNAVLPGFVETENYKKMDAKMKQTWIDNTPIKRFIKPEEIAEVYLLLATTRIMTGSLIIADGGTSTLGR